MEMKILRRELRGAAEFSGADEVVSCDETSSAGVSYLKSFPRPTEERPR